jgi:mycoredoxin-dependent peroxiredoxin
MSLVGQPAPDFTLTNQFGSAVTLSELKGKKVVLIFFPFAFSGLCTGELCEIRDRIGSFQSDDTVTVAVSCDTKFTQAIFAERDGYTFDLLSDHWPHGAVAQAYGVFNDDRGVALRATFIIDADGIVRWEVRNAIPDTRDVAEYESVLASL